MNELTLRFARNLEYLRAEVPVLHKLISGHIPKSDLIINDDGSVNIRKVTGEMMYGSDARRELDVLMEKYIRRPSRIVLEAPVVDKNFDESASEFDGEWPTKKYDGKTEDIHYQRYLGETSRALKDAGVSIGSEFTGQPYYLLVYGIGAGYQILPLLKHFRPKMLLLIDESKDGLVHASSLIDWEEIWAATKEIGTEIKLVMEGDGTRLHKAVKNVIASSSILGMDGIHVFFHGSQGVLKQAYQKLFDGKLAGMATFAGSLANEFNIVKNSFRNLRKGDKRLLRAVRDPMRTPVLIVGSGPSLESSIDHLKKVQDRFVIIASGSSMRVLLSHGIQPDFYCNLNDAQSTLLHHESLAAEGFDLADICAVLPSNIYPGVDRFFKDSIYFLRPGLSPFCVFAESLGQALQNEGSQSINTAFALARHFAAKEVYLLGLDFGTADPDVPRAVSAWPTTRVRKLDAPVRGSKGNAVFTDMKLLQQKAVLEAQIRNLIDVGGHCYNLGNGAKIKGAAPSDIETLALELLDGEKKHYLSQFIAQFPTYSRETFLANWSNEVVRGAVTRFINDLLLKMAANGWKNEMVAEIETICSCANKPLSKQYPIRLVRSTLMRIFLHAHRVVQRIETDEKRESAINLMKQILERHIRQMETEIYGLADELEAEDPAFNLNFAAA